MASSKPKSVHLAQIAVEQFIRRHKACYFWSTTFQDCPSKAVAEERLKPLRDLLKRHGGAFLGVWERQERGSYHLHWLTNIYLDVNFLRPWLVARGWGVQMRVDIVAASPARWDGQHWVRDTSNVEYLVRYLTKYITKSLNHDDGTKSKSVVQDKASRVGTVRFSWCPWVRPGAYLYAMGREFYFQLYGRPASWKVAKHCIRLGVEVTNWLEIDPWYEAPS